MIDSSLKNKAFKLKGRIYTLTVLAVLDHDPEEFALQLREITAQAPNFFKFAPVVLDFSELPSSEFLDLKAVCRVLREYMLVPVAVQAANPLIESLAQCEGLAILSGSASHDKNIETAPKEDTKTKTAVAKTEAVKTKLVTSPVRSGQQILSRSDLVIAAAVSHGAELLADGNIHVYGTLRGRALAGISGDKQARIFCQALEAELVSIAGFYRLSDAIEPVSGPCQIFIQDDRIQIEPL